MKTYTIFAGVNGAGKTSMYQSIYVDKNEKRINTDEMVSRIGSWKDENLQAKCAREAVKLINEYITNGISFNQETTLCGKSIIRNIKAAKKNGFYVVLNYISLDNPETAKNRVAKRVEKGGHGIPEEVIERRYYNSQINLKKVVNLCDQVKIYDNTNKFKAILAIKSGTLIWKDDILPSWITDLDI